MVLKKPRERGLGGWSARDFRWEPVPERGLVGGDDASLAMVMTGGRDGTEQRGDTVQLGEWVDEVDGTCPDRTHQLGHRPRHPVLIKPSTIQYARHVTCTRAGATR